MAYTGYIVRKYIDENPNSPTYGETWTEKTLDTTHCPNDGGGWSLVATECELVTSGFTGYRIDTYYNSVTNDYRTERTLDSICHASTDDEIWYNIGDVYCEQNDDGTYTGFGIQEQKQINPNLYNFGIVRKTRVASPECEEHLEPEWQDIQKECNIVQEPGTGTLHYDGTANILQIDINPSSPTFNQTRTINVEDEECEYIPCERVEYEWFYKEESCGSLIPEYYHLENIVPDTVYKIYQMYSKCYVDNVVVRERPENVYSAVTYQEGVSDCLYRWLQTEQTVCEDTYRERWVDSGTTCEDTDKYSVQVKEVSEDGGQTWSATSETRLELIEENSYDCGYRTRTISGTPYCDYTDFNKCVRVENQVSRDGGQTWETTGSTIHVIDEHSEDCINSYYSGKYLTFEAIDSGTFSFSGSMFDGPSVYSEEGINNSYIQYSKNNSSTWYTLSRGNTVSVNAGDTIRWKATNIIPVVYTIYGADGYVGDGPGRFASTGRFKVYGNVMSLYYGDNFTNKTDLSDKMFAFDHLFSGCTCLIDAECLILPATTLSYECYGSMFTDCSRLETTPRLPATTLATYCYYYMFESCSGLTSVPYDMLPATNLNGAPGCYMLMFCRCRNLVNAPNLFATTLSPSCYQNMFQECSGLESPPSLPATTLSPGCYWGMFWGCNFRAAPYLPATTLVEDCYVAMFSHCTRLNSIICNAIYGITATNCDGWVNSVASSGTFMKNANATWSITGEDGVPSGWTITNKT